MIIAYLLSNPQFNIWNISYITSQQSYNKVIRYIKTVRPNYDVDLKEPPKTKITQPTCLLELFFLEPAVEQLTLTLHNLKMNLAISVDHDCHFSLWEYYPHQ